MCFILSILYFVTYYLTPTTLFGPLAMYRLELILAAFILFVSPPAFVKSLVWKTPQCSALIGLAFAAFLSVLLATRWVGGAVQAFLGFLPTAFAYFLVCLHSNSRRKLQGIVLMLLFVCLFVVARGSFDLYHEMPESPSLQQGAEEHTDLKLWNIEHPYLLVMKNDSGESIYRLRGLGLINDPNDFGQLLVSVIPLMFIFWRPEKLPRNVTLVLLPECALIYGVYLTHSRGALVALMAMTVIAVRPRIGTWPALLIATSLFAAAMALHFTGGREITVDAGYDRTSLWSQALQVFKLHPLFGVGFGRLSEYTDVHLTAHNSIVCCATELGFIGLWLWSLFVFSSVRNAVVITSPSTVREAAQPVTEESLFPVQEEQDIPIDRAEIHRLGRLVVLAFTGFLVAGWFLSRPYTMTLFLLGGVTEVVLQMAIDRRMTVARLRFSRAVSYSGGLAVALVVIMYVMLRIMNLIR